MTDKTVRYQLLPTKEGGDTIVEDHDKYYKCCGYYQPKRQVQIFGVLGVLVIGFLIALIILLSIDDSGISDNNNNGTCSAFLTTRPTPSHVTHPATFASSNPSFPYHHVRLPTSIKPIHYDLFLQPNYHKLINQGNVTIFLHCHQTTNFILFHIRGLTIHDLRIVGDTIGDELTITETLQDPRNDYYYVKLNSSLTTGTNYTLTIRFSGAIYPNLLRGFYRSTYVTASGQKRYSTCKRSNNE